MKMDNKIKTFLLSKLNFSAENIRTLERNRDLLNSTMGLLAYLKEHPNNLEATQYIKVEFRKIRSSLNQLSRWDGGFLQEERKKYYSFCKPTGQTMLGAS